MMTIRTQFDRQLRMLDNDLLRLAELVETQLVDAVTALYNHDLAAAQRVEAYDSALNKLRYEIEEQAYTMLALQQPNGTDMRRIVAAVSIATNLERMGDHAAGIARLIIRTHVVQSVVHVPAFKEMSAMACESLRLAMTALGNRDGQMARSVVTRDEEIDQIHKRTYDLLIRTMIDNPSTVEYATMLLWVSHNIERFADRVSNICERINYVATGELYKPRLDKMP
jgi:phosphate transport system protein